MSSIARGIQRAIKRHGELVTRQIRSVGSRDATSGQAAITFPTTTEIYGVIGRALTRTVITEAGAITHTTREYTTKDTLLRGDRVVLADGTYEVTTKPTVIEYKGQFVARKCILTRLEFV